jgi:hypothetical protein
MYRRADWRRQIVLGAVGGFAGTLAIQAFLTARHKWLPKTMPPIRQDPGTFMVETGEAAFPEPVRQRIPQVVERGAARLLAVGYGLTFGALYTLLRPRGGSPLLDDVLLGLANWAVGYVGWLPAFGLIPHLAPARAPGHGPMAEHALYGMVLTCHRRAVGTGPQAEQHMCPGEEG